MLWLRGLFSSSNRVPDIAESRKSPAPATKSDFDVALRLIETRNLPEAASVLRRVLGFDPAHAVAWYKLGNVLKDLAQYDEAIASYQRAIELDPRHSAALCNCSVALLALGRTHEALAGLRRALEIDPKDPIAHYNCAVVENVLGQGDSSLASVSQALAIRPNYAEAHFLCGLLHENAGAWVSALAGYDRAVELAPGLPGLQLHRGNVLARLNRWQDALESFDLAVASDPSDTVAHLHRGNVLRELKRSQLALNSYDRAISTGRGGADAHFNRGVLLEQLQRLPEAVESFDRAIHLNPNHAQAQHNRSLALLRQGDLLRGFESYEWRWKNRSHALTAEQYHPQLPLWDGRESIEGKTVLVFSEQGLGDTLHFCRYVKYVAARGAMVIFEVQDPLLKLLANLEGATKVISRGMALPDCDYKIPLMSLPRLLGTTLDSIPVERGYLQVDPKLVEEWRAKLGRRDKPRIGLVWSGNSENPGDRYRSLPLEILVHHLPGEFRYYCLQRDLREADRRVLAANRQIVDFAPDFLDTAALCQNMDIVISVCTSVAHLAGALGRPLWLLLSFNADWRWFLGREDTPWYPSAKLYRQISDGEWNELVERVAHDLVLNLSRL